MLNLDGEVIGINTMKALAADGVSFAIPIDSAIKIVDQLKKRRSACNALSPEVFNLLLPCQVLQSHCRPAFENYIDCVGDCYHEQFEAFYDMITFISSGTSYGLGLE